jgi:DNA-binding IclR family transcriptional regulator
MSPERDTSIRRGLDVLTCLGSEEAIGLGGLGVTRIAELIGKEKSQVSRSLKILAEYGMVDRDPRTLVYRLGWRIFSMAQLAGDRRLLEKASVQLTRLVGELAESVYLSVLNGREALTLLARSPDREVQATAWAGRSFPAYSSSVGRVLLSQRSEREIRALFAGVPLVTKAAPMTVEDLLARLARTRQHGYAVVDQEFEPGLISVAAPVVDARGAVIAALNASGPSFRFAAEVGTATAAVVAAARQLSLALAGPDEALEKDEMADRIELPDDSLDAEDAV